MLHNPALEAAIVADPDAESAYLVYGDWLLDRGDPRGELSTLDRALAADPWGDRGAELRARRSALFDTHRDALLDLERAPIALNRAALAFLSGRPEEAAARTSTVIEAARRRGDTHWETHGLNHRGTGRSTPVGSPTPKRTCSRPCGASSA